MAHAAYMYITLSFSPPPFPLPPPTSPLPPSPLPLPPSSSPFLLPLLPLLLSPPPFPSSFPLSPQLPWSEFDNQFQIMFQLGNGKSPTIPEGSLSSEGHDFLSHCFEQDPSQRWRANHLLDHPFVKVCP